MPVVRKIAAAPGAVQPVSLEQAKLHCRVDHAEEDALIGLFIGAATQDATDRLQRALVPTQYRLHADGFGPSPRGPLDLLLPPVLSVQEVRYQDPAGDWQTLPTSAWRADTASQPAQLWPALGTDWPTVIEGTHTVQVDYTAGYADSAIPEPIKAWILLAVADLYDNRTRSADKPAVPQHFAEALLDPYKLWSL